MNRKTNENFRYFKRWKKGAQCKIDMRRVLREGLSPSRRLVAQKARTKFKIDPIESFWNLEYAFNALIFFVTFQLCKFTVTIYFWKMTNCKMLYRNFISTKKNVSYSLLISQPTRYIVLKITSRSSNRSYTNTSKQKRSPF